MFRKFSLSFKVIFCLIFGCPVLVWSQSHKILKIRVLDEKTEEPLIGANVEINGTFYITDIDGMVAFQGDFPIHIKVDYVSYETKSIVWDEAETEVFKIMLHESRTLLDMVTVTGSKFERNLSESTISLDILQPDIVRSTNVSKSSDVLNKVPGVQILDGQANIRGGSGYSYGAGSRVMLLVNEIPFLQVDAGFPNWSDIPIEALGQVE